MRKKIIILSLCLIFSSFIFYSLVVDIETAESSPDFWGLSPSGQLMARTIYAEGRGEPFLGQVAVGAVIMNRVRDGDFPNTISGVIYQPWAFTPVAYGYIWNHIPDATAVRATVSAINGWDPTYGSLYFYNPAKVTSYWIFSRTVVRRIGSHVFAR